MRQLYYLYASKARERDQRFYNAKAGDVIRNATKESPCLILEQHPFKVHVSDWPGRLWLAEDADPSLRNELMSNILPSVSYIRTIAVRLVEEKSPALLFGEHGQAVCELLDTLLEMTQEQAEALSKAYSLDVVVAYSNAWNRWIEKNDPTSSHLNQNHHKTLGAASKVQRKDSAINKGFFIFSTLMDRKAKELDAEGAYDWVKDDDGEYEDSLIAVYNQRWSHIFDVLAGALMAVGAPQYLSDEERSLLLKGWCMLQKP